MATALGPGLTIQHGPFKHHSRDVPQFRKTPWKGGGVAGGGTLHAGNGNWFTQMTPTPKISRKLGIPKPSKYSSIITDHDIYVRPESTKGKGKFGTGAPRRVPGHIIQNNIFVGQHAGSNGGDDAQVEPERFNAPVGAIEDEEPEYVDAPEGSYYDDDDDDSTTQGGFPGDFPIDDPDSGHFGTPNTQTPISTPVDVNGDYHETPLHTPLIRPNEPSVVPNYIEALEREVGAVTQDDIDQGEFVMSMFPSYTDYTPRQPAPFQGFHSGRGGVAYPVSRGPLIRELATLPFSGTPRVHAARPVDSRPVPQRRGRKRKNDSQHNSPRGKRKRVDGRVGKRRILVEAPGGPSRALAVRRSIQFEDITTARRRRDFGPWPRRR